MEKETIIANNKLLAEFMGYDDVDCPNCKHTSGCNWLQCGLTPHEKDEQLKYHSSWDWLMSVVKKIDALGISIDDEVGSARQYSVVGSSIGMVTIESVWLACVEFIKWYNQNKATETTEPCPNCKETKQPCACMRNICHKCGKPVGNITFTVCDECWDIEFPPKK